jgi:hypothetical protein
LKQAIRRKVDKRGDIYAAEALFGLEKKDEIQHFKPIRYR